MLPFLVTPCLVVAVQPCMERIPIKKKKKKKKKKALNEESDEVDGDLEVAIEEEQNHVDVAEVCVSVERCADVCWRRK